jgi:hypothetical protein
MHSIVKLFDRESISEEMLAEYSNKGIANVYPYLILTDTDSCSVQFIILAKNGHALNEETSYKWCIEQLITYLKDKIDLSNEYFEQFNCRDHSTRKQMGLYDFEALQNYINVTLCSIPKEYYEE